MLVASIFALLPTAAADHYGPRHKTLSTVFLSLSQVYFCAILSAQLSIALLLLHLLSQSRPLFCCSHCCCGGNDEFYDRHPLLVCIKHEALLHYTKPHQNIQIKSIPNHISDMISPNHQNIPSWFASNRKTSRTPLRRCTIRAFMGEKSEQLQILMFAFSFSCNP